MNETRLMFVKLIVVLSLLGFGIAIDPYVGDLMGRVPYEKLWLTGDLISTVSDTEQVFEFVLDPLIASFLGHLVTGILCFWLWGFSELAVEEAYHLAHKPKDIMAIVLLYLVLFSVLTVLPLFTALLNNWLLAAAFSPRFPDVPDAIFEAVSVFLALLLILTIVPFFSERKREIWLASDNVTLERKQDMIREGNRRQISYREQSEQQNRYRRDNYRRDNDRDTRR